MRLRSNGLLYSYWRYACLFESMPWLILEFSCHFLCMPWSCVETDLTYYVICMSRLLRRFTQELSMLTWTSPATTSCCKAASQIFGTRLGCLILALHRSASQVCAAYLQCIPHPCPLLQAAAIHISTYPGFAMQEDFCPRTS